MTRADDLEDRIREVVALRDAAATEAGRDRVRAALRAKHGRLVRAAAQVARRWEERTLVRDLVDAFQRLLRGPAKADAGCEAKTAIVDALGVIGEDQDGAGVVEHVFLAGARHTQLESVWGGQVDTAGSLRAACAAGLAAWHHGEALLVLADHLADPLPDVRGGAAQSLGQRGREDGVPLLRLRLRLGDEPRVLGECARALLALAPASSIDLVSVLLADHDDACFGEAALALGESRETLAVDALCGAWRATFDVGRRKVLLTALAAARCEEALAFLLRCIEEEAPDLAAEAVGALAAYARDESVRARVADAVARCDAEEVARRFAADFAS